MPHSDHLSGCGSASGKICTCEMRRYGYIFGITLVIFVAQTIGSIISGSLALFADTVHVGLDGAGALISMFVASQVRHRKDPDAFRVRWMRVSGIMLLIALIWIAYEAVERLRSPQDVAGLRVMVIASFGAAMNYWQHRLVPHDHTDTSYAQRLHVLGDLATSIAVVIGGFLIWLTSARWIDPILSLAVVAFVGILTIRMLMRPTEAHDHSGHTHDHGHTH